LDSVTVKKEVNTEKMKRHAETAFFDFIIPYWIRSYVMEFEAEFEFMT